MESKMESVTEVIKATASPSTTRNKKVPGDVPAMGRLSHEAKAFQKEIRLKSVPELKDLLAR
jgi:hypothetical protein